VRGATILGPGAHAGSPADKARVADTRQVLIRVSPTKRARALRPLRPFRVHIDPTQDGAEVVNAVSDRVRAEILKLMSGKRLIYRPLTGTMETQSVGIARATKGDVTPAGEKFCEVLRQTSIEANEARNIQSVRSSRRRSA
jgi:hypothetical protein